MQFTLLLTIGLVVLVIFLFLRNVSATLIPSLALPLSIVGTFAVMYLLGFTLDIISLMALTLCVGFVVDDAIVMLENIVRHMEMGEGRMEAALNGSREIGFTIISMTLSLAAVFIPVLFMGGIVGRLLHEFAVTIGAAILVSGFVSLTLTPMLCSRFLRPPHGGQQPPVTAPPSASSTACCAPTTSRCGGRCATAASTMAVAARSRFVATAWLFMVIPKGFLPTEDTADLRVHRGGPGRLVRRDVAHQQAVAEIVRQQPARRAVHVVHRRQRLQHRANTGRIFIRLKPRERAPARRRDHRGAAAQARRRCRASASSADPADHPHRRPAHQGRLPVHAAGRRPRRSSTTGRRSSSSGCAQLPGLQDVTSDLQITSPQIIVDIDRDKAAALGVTRRQIENALDTAYGSRQVSTIYTPTNQYWVILEVEPQYQRDPTALAPALRARRATAGWCRSTRSPRLTPGLGPLTVNHLGQLPAVTISFNTKPGRLAGRRGGPGRGRAARAARAGHAQRDVPGHGPGVPGLAARAWACCCSSPCS